MYSITWRLFLRVISLGNNINQVNILFSLQSLQDIYMYHNHIQYSSVIQPFLDIYVYDVCGLLDLTWEH